MNVLNLSHNPIGCAGAQQLAKALRRNKIVIDLDVSGCSIGRNGCRALTSALAENDTLKSLKLSWNNFGDSMSASCLAAMVAGNRTLARLRLVMVGLGDAHGTAIAKAMDAALRVRGAASRYRAIGASGGVASCARAVLFACVSSDLI